MKAEEIKKAVSLLRKSNYIIALTGAGISTESGIPDFRGPNGLWKRINPEYGTYTFFHNHPDIFWKLYLDFYKDFEKAKPNQTHYSLVELERMGLLKSIITQNIDGLHQKAGSSNVIELHGDLRTILCTKCERKYSYSEVLKIIDEEGFPPRCRVCGGVLKPNVVLFGESLPYEAISKAYEEASKADLILVLGTSLAVYPAAYIPDLVKSRGGKVLIVNMGPTERDEIGDLIIYGRLGEVLSKIVEYLKR